MKSQGVTKEAGLNDMEIRRNLRGASIPVGILAGIDSGTLETMDSFTVA